MLHHFSALASMGQLIKFKGILSAMRLMTDHSRWPHDEPSCLAVLWLGEFLGKGCRLKEDIKLILRAGCFFIGLCICCHGFVLGNPVHGF